MSQYQEFCKKVLDNYKVEWHWSMKEKYFVIIHTKITKIDETDDESGWTLNGAHKLELFYFVLLNLASHL